MENTLENIIGWARRNNCQIRSMDDVIVLEEQLVSSGYLISAEQVELDRLSDLHYELYLQMQCLHRKLEINEQKHDKCLEMLKEVVNYILPKKSDYINKKEYREALANQMIDSKMYGKRRN